MKSAQLKHALRLATDTKECLVGEGALANFTAIFAALFAGRQALIVGDTNTMRVAGNQLRQCLMAGNLSGAEPLVLDARRLYAEMSYVEYLTEALRKTAAIPVAVGSGTINDLVKLAAHRLKRPYISVATAASMDGYTAFGASITAHGCKQTFTCAAPWAVVVDLDLIAAAPPQMTAAGYADLLAKTVAGADWLLAAALGVETVDPVAWDIVQGGLEQALRDPLGARRGVKQVLSLLMEGLLLSGLAIQYAQSSRPASGAEHQFSHLWDMENYLYNGESPSHGFKVGVATQFIATLYERLLAAPLEKLDLTAACAHWPPDVAAATAQTCALFDTQHLRDFAVQETAAKYISRQALATQLTLLRNVWPQLRERLRHHLAGFGGAAVLQRLAAVGAPPHHTGIGVSHAAMQAAARRAQAIRRRFTVLDVVARANIICNEQQSTDFALRSTTGK